jgi:hypothetical protein
MSILNALHSTSAKVIYIFGMRVKNRCGMKFLIIAKVRQTPVDVWAKLLSAHFSYQDEPERKKSWRSHTI